MSATRSPGATPSATSPLATALTSSWNSAHVTWVHPPEGVLREKAVSPAASRALRTGRSARLPSVVTGASGATTLSFTVTPDWWELWCTIPIGNRADHVAMITVCGPASEPEPVDRGCRRPHLGTHATRGVSGPD